MRGDEFRRLHWTRSASGPRNQLFCPNRVLLQLKMRPLWRPSVCRSLLHRTRSLGPPCSHPQLLSRYNSSQTPPPPPHGDDADASVNGSADSIEGQHESADSLSHDLDNSLGQNIFGDMKGSADELFGEEVYPNVAYPAPFFDAGHSEVFHGRLSKRTARVTVRNATPIADLIPKGQIRYVPEEKSADDPMNFLPIHTSKLRFLHRYPLITRRVTQQTGKGKIHRIYVLVVMGNGDGLVGFGEGKHDDFGKAQDKAVIEAVRNMDYVERFESRTIWTNMDTKLGATRILMRPRPVGFGLHCNPVIHQVLKAAGVKDVSAKVWGSRNPINVIKATCRMIQAGNAPLGMGNGIGGKGKKLDAGSGMRSREAIERERGRKLVEGYA